MPSSIRYDTSSLVFHWVTALVVTIAFTLGPGDFGRLMHDGVDPGSHIDIVWHESLGILVMVLTVLRLLWLVLRPSAPRIPMPDWMQWTSRLTHLGLWVLLLALPITAILGLGIEGHPLTILGGVRVDQIPLVAKSGLASLADWGEVHKFLGEAIMWLAGLHAVAAIYHHVVRKDGVLSAMLPLVRRR